MAITLADIEVAQRTIAGRLLRTPMLPAPKLSALTGASVRVKYENLQVTNSFKERVPRSHASHDVTIINGVDTIDASAVDTSFLGHSYFAENRSVIADLFALVRKDAAPAERFGTRPMTAAGLPYWMFAP